MNTQRILEFIQKFYEENGVPPSCRDIQEAIGFKSPRAVTWHINILFKEGFLVRANGWARSYLPVGYKVIKEPKILERN